MTQMTITEALAEIKTVGKRIASKKEFVSKYLFRVETMKDPLEKDGGSSVVLRQELQAIADLEQRVVDLRRGIQKANDETKLTIEGVEKSISDWLIWRREVSEGHKSFLRSIRSGITQIRDEARRQKLSGTEKPLEVIINVDEKAISAEAEKLEVTLGTLDGQLSLKNATVMVA